MNNYSRLIEPAAFLLSFSSLLEVCTDLITEVVLNVFTPAHASHRPANCFIVQSSSLGVGYVVHRTIGLNAEPLRLLRRINLGADEDEFPAVLLFLILKNRTCVENFSVIGRYAVIFSDTRVFMLPSSKTYFFMTSVLAPRLPNIVSVLKKTCSPRPFYFMGVLIRSIIPGRLGVHHSWDLHPKIRLKTENAPHRPVRCTP